MRKKMILIIAMLMVVIIMGCSKDKSDDVYTYSKLTDIDKKIIDVIYDSRDSWEALDGYSCRTVDFIKNNDDIVFVVGCPTEDISSGKTEGGGSIASSGYVYKIALKVDETGLYSYDNIEEIEDEIMMRTSFNRNYNVDDSENDKRDVLATQYYNRILNN